MIVSSQSEVICQAVVMKIFLQMLFTIYLHFIVKDEVVSKNFSISISIYLFSSHNIQIMVCTKGVVKYMGDVDAIINAQRVANGTQKLHIAKSQ